MKKLVTLALLGFHSICFSQDNYELLENIHYYPETANQSDSYVNERCVLDVYYPKDVKNFPTIVWFHGGGLTGGNKFIPEALKEKGVAIVAVNYRLYPKIKAPVYIEDAAAAVSWTFKNIEDYGGDPSLIFVSGHSAGGYLASMVGIDKRWLTAHELDANNIAGLIPFSGHTITHFTVRAERGIPGTTPLIDEMAPLYHVRDDAPPLLLITGDREKELLGRYEENAFMMRMMKVAGHQDTRLMELDGYGHGMTEPAYPLLLEEVKRIVNEKTRPNIVFIIADDASWKHFGTYGSAELKTPNIDRLAKEGVVFENAFVSTSSCTPSRASILTGRNGFELEEGATLWGYLPAKFPTYTDILKQHGYRVGATGKGWGPGFLVDRKINPAGQPYNMIKHKPYSAKFEKTPVSDIDYASNFESFLKTTDQEKAFCFWVGTYEPHRGYKAGLANVLGINCDSVTVPSFMPDAKEVREDICEYYAEIEHIDDQIGEVMKVLENQDMLDNTLILITSDNGMPFPRAKATLYDYGTHMPMIAWWGNKIEPGRRIKDMVSFTDIAPTFLDAAGLATPWEMSGKSFLPLLKSSNSGLIDNSRNKVYMYRERHVFYPDSHGITYPARAVRTEDYLLIWNLFPDRIPSDVDGGSAKKYMNDNQEQFQDLYNLAFGKRPEYELYDIKKDTFQLNNLSGKRANSKVLAGLKADLEGYLKKRKDPRMEDKEGAFVLNPYFGTAFQKGLLQWTPEQQGQKLTFQERRELLEKAYAMMGENAIFDKMIEKQQGKL